MYSTPKTAKCNPKCNPKLLKSVTLNCNPKCNPKDKKRLEKV
nr:MAG TPA: hypothetical protein [Caudoviricetes sp.]